MRSPNGRGPHAPGRRIRPDPPVELRAWNWASLALLAAFMLLGAATRSRLVGAAILAAGALVQVGFGLLVASNRRDVAGRLAAYYAERPLLLGGFIANRYPIGWRLQGAGMAGLGVLLAVGAAVLARSGG